MIPYIIGGLALSTVALFRARPHSSSKKRESIGGVSGTVYQVDDFTDIGVVVVIAPDGSKGVFKRGAPTQTSRGPLIFESGWPAGPNGRVTLIAMLKDFGQEVKPRAVAPQEAASESAGVKS